MANKFVDQNGMLYFWQKILAKFQKKEDGKGLSTNDYTTDEKNKLAGIETGANNYTLPTAAADTLGGIKVGQNLSISEDGVLSANAQQIEVDDVLNADSTNPVQNKTVQAALNEKINTSVLGQAKGVATLDETGLIPSSQLPSYVDDVIEGYADVTITENKDENGYKTTTVVINGFYSDEAHENAITGEAGKIYVDLKTNISYRWGGSVWVTITSTDCTAVTNAEIDEIIATTI